MERAVLAVDVNHALAKLSDAVVAWHNEQSGDELQVDAVTADGWQKLWTGLQTDKKRAFYSSPQFSSGLEAVAGAKEALQPLRAVFSLVAVADRPRATERATREWLDANFSGVFDRLLVVDGADAEALGERKKKLLGDLKVRAAVGADASALSALAADLERCVLVGALPWAKDQASKMPKTTKVADWPAARAALEQLAKDLELKAADKVGPGPKLTRGTDDLVVVTLRKPAVFYANMINAKMTRQNQETVRLQATEGAITTAVQTAEMLRAQSITTTAKISTRYVVSRSKDHDNYRVPKIEILLQRVDRKP